jgi:hypothetical protein
LATYVKPALEKLNQDADHDVQYFANEALDSKFKENVLLRSKDFHFFELIYFSSCRSY